jgi:peptide/nickel transport system permease protein
MSAPVPHLTSGSQTRDVIDVATADAPVEVAAIRPPPGAPGGRVIGRSPGQLAWMRLRRDKVAMTAMWALVVFVVLAVFADVIRMLYGYSTMQSAANGSSDLLDGTGIPLGYLGGLDFTTANASHHIHILGVEPSLGRDLFIQVLYGIRTSLLISFVSVTIATTFGVVVGIAAGFIGGWLDSVVNWVIDYMLAFPFFLFALAVIPVVNTHLHADNGSPAAWQRVITIIVVFSAFAWMSTARLVRGQVLSLREREYVDAAKAAGARLPHMLFRQLLPNLWAPILVTYSLGVPLTITAEGALSFIGIGVTEPTPDLGRLVYNSQAWLHADSAYLLIPGLTIFLIVLAFNLFGDALRDSLDPKSSR